MVFGNLICCRSKASKPQDDIDTTGHTDNTFDSFTQPCQSTGTLIESILPLVLPIVRKAVNTQLIKDKSVLYNEELVEEIPSRSSSIPLPIGEIQVNIDNVFVMNYQSVQEDMERYPKFAWPEKDNLKEYMKNVDGKGRQSLVVDVVGLDMKLPLAAGIEIQFPVDLPFSKNAHVEIGSGGNVTHPFVKMDIPRLRIWFIAKTKMLYVAIMEKPKLTPCLHVNLDRGNGDFMNIVLQEEGALDDIVETIMAGFGPYNYDDGEEDIKNRNGASSTNKTVEDGKKDSWIGKAVGKAISKLILTQFPGRNNAPISVPLAETIDATINSMMGLPRPINEIEAHMELLKKELELAKKLENEKESEKGLEIQSKSTFRSDNRTNSKRDFIKHEEKIEDKYDEGCNNKALELDNEVVETGATSSQKGSVGIWCF